MRKYFTSTFGNLFDHYSLHWNFEGSNGSNNSNTIILLRKRDWKLTAVQFKELSLLTSSLETSIQTGNPESSPDVVF